MGHLEDNEKKFDFVFCHRAKENGRYWGIVKYYQSQETEKVREMLSEAAGAFWDGSAYFEETQDWEIARYRATECSYKIASHIAYLRDEFELFSSEELPQPPILLPQSEPVGLEFRYQVKAASRRGKLMQYLSSDTIFTNLEKILLPSEAFWSAIAWRELDLLSPEQLRVMAFRCLNQLQSHRDFLQEIFPLKVLAAETLVSSSEKNGHVSLIEAKATHNEDDPYGLYESPFDELGETLFN